MKKDKYLTHSIVTYDFEKKMTYDGTQFQTQFTSENYGILGNSVLIFRGGMKLTPKEMVDIKDIMRESHLADILISSEDALHFIIEEFDIQPPNMEIAYYRLRLLVQIIIEELHDQEINAKRKGTDIFIEEKKLNVGIASIGGNSMKIHLGINIQDKGVPKHVKATSLQNIGFNKNEISKFAEIVSKKYIRELKKIKEDIVKTKCLR